LRSAVGNPIPGAKENEERFENQALRPALTFYASGAGLRGRTGTDQRKVAAHFAEAVSITGAVLLLLLFSLESSRSNPSDRGAGLRDFSAVLILSLLLSPVTWVQHLVFLIPAIYLLVAQELAISPLPNLARAGLIAFAGASLLLNREILGKNLYEILLAYRLHTILMLVVVALLLTCAPMAGSRRAETA